MYYEETDWLGMWRELATVLKRQLADHSFHDKKTAKKYEERTKKKNREKKDELLDFVCSRLNLQDTVLDIGAGTGRWTVPMAKNAKSVTAVEPSQAMLDILKQKVVDENLGNVSYIKEDWEKAEAGVYDVVVGAHSIYGIPDLAAVIAKIERSARNWCYLGLRMVAIDGIMSELSRKIYGHPNDSTNFTIAYNALYSMGIYANVLVEQQSISRWRNVSIEEALERAKRHLYLKAEDTSHDAVIREVLERRLTLTDGEYLWPDGMRSALVWWQPGNRKNK